MHNFTVPAPFKLWIDQVVRSGRTFRSTPEGKIGLLKDRPTFVIVATGSAVAGPWAHQPDFLTPYLSAVLGTIGIHNLNFIRLEGTSRDAIGTLARARSAMQAKWPICAQGVALQAIGVLHAARPAAAWAQMTRAWVLDRRRGPRCRECLVF